MPRPSMPAAELKPLILPLGDHGLLVRFGNSLSGPANEAAIAFGRTAEGAGLPGVVEVMPNLISVLLIYRPDVIGFERLAGEVRLLASGPSAASAAAASHLIAVHFDGADLDAVAAATRLSVTEFVAAHNAAPLRVLATGFAPGFLYCGFHPAALHLPRRAEVRRQVAAGTVLFAAGQTAITSTAIPTGWHVIGRTEFRNFDPASDSPTRVRAGDTIAFEALQ